MHASQNNLKIFFGWYIVGACFLIALYVTGVVHYGFTAVFEPIAEEFGWSYAQISLAASLRGLEIGLLAPIMGILVDRLGPRKIVIVGSIILCAGFLLLSRVSSLAMFYGSFALIAIGISTCTSTVLMATVANWFQEKVGMAIGITSSGFGLGGLLVPVVTKLIDSLQWRRAMSVLGLGMVVIVLPLSLLIRHKPEHYGYQLDGEKNDNMERRRDWIANMEINIPTREVFSQRVFWNVTIASLILVMMVSAIITHIMPALSILGIERSTSSMIALILPVTSSGGRLGGGWLTDKFGNKKVFIASFIMLSIGMLIFTCFSAEKMWLLGPFIITFCLGWGFGATTRMSLIREYFGRNRFGTILGFLSGIMMLGNVLGAPIAGLAFDTWGSYQNVWLGFSILGIAGVLLAFAIPSLRVIPRKLERS